MRRTHGGDGRSLQSRAAPGVLWGVVAIAVGCGSEVDDGSTRGVIMSLRNDERLAQLKVRLLDGMRAFIEDDEEPDYEERDIERVGQILDEHVAAIERVNDKKQALECVRDTVMKLNELSERCESLIETGQREDICEFIDRAGARFGFGADDEDVTEEWREW